MSRDEIYKYSITTAYSYKDWELVCEILGTFGPLTPDIKLLDIINQQALISNVSPIEIAMILT